MIEAALLRGVSVPALNKWTKVFPCAGAVVLLSHFYDFGKEAFKFIFGALSEQEESNSEGQASEDRELGVPVKEVKRWRRLARRAQQKGNAFHGRRRVPLCKYDVDPSRGSSDDPALVPLPQRHVVVGQARSIRAIRRQR